MTYPKRLIEVDLPIKRISPQARRDFQIVVKRRDGWVDQASAITKIESPKFDGTVKRGSATSPCCGYTTPATRVRELGLSDDLTST